MMRLAALLALLCVLVATLFWWHQPPASGWGTSLPRHVATDTDMAGGAGLAVPPRVSAADAGSAYQSAVWVKPPVRLSEDALHLQVDVVRQANQGPDPFPALESLAQQGNAAAMLGVARVLTRCLFVSLRVRQVGLDGVRANLQLARSELHKLLDGSVADERVARAQRSVARLEHRLNQANSFLQACNTTSRPQLWDSFVWYERARRAGHPRAMRAFLKRLDEVFHSPQMVARNMDRALALRARGRRYLERMLRDCSRRRLLAYGRYLPRLVDLGIYRRYVLQWVLEGPEADEHGSATTEAVQSSDPELRRLAKWLPADRIQAARREAGKMWVVCLGT